MKKTVVVGMSGGVDSSVAAYLLKEQGYQVIGVTMKLWQAGDTHGLQQESGCCGLRAVDDARRAAMQLGIPYYVMDFRKEFQTHVIDYFIREYRQGRTPNPCIACNRYVKWESLLQRSVSIGADYIATGHYARIVQKDGRYAIAVSAAVKKDQSYALYNLTQEQLRRTLFPAGEYTKKQIREIASRIGLSVAQKPDSQEICFVPDKDYAGFISRASGSPEQPGRFVSRDGKILGQHRGISHYTVGQRKGLGLALGHPAFVTGICADTNEVFIGSKEDLMAAGLAAGNMNYMAAKRFWPGQEMTAKIRYSHAGEACTVTHVSDDGGSIRIRFRRPVRAVTPGQAAVFYRDGLVLGGGTIEAGGCP